MEIVMSAVAGELVSRFISFLVNKYNSSRPRSAEQVEERLQYLLMRACTIVEEADTRYLTNSSMMMQLKTLSEAMYRAYRGWISRGTRPSKMVQAPTRPYDVYLYTENFMFARHAEKQRLLSFLLQHNDHPGDCAPDVLPIIGGAAIGKKTLVAHVCGDIRVRSRFSSVLHLNGDNLMRIDQGRSMFGMMLVVIEFASDIGDDEWKKFHSFVKRMGRGSKIIIISKLQGLARFGSVKPVFLSTLSYDELRYLFKTLVFGSVDPAEHPRLVQIADEFAKVQHSITLVSTNMFADVLRRNLDVKFWRCILEKGLKMVQRNLSMYGELPTMLVQQGQPVDITDFAMHPLSMTRYTINASIKEESPSVTFGELLIDPSVRPEQDFILVSWKSRIAPHNTFAHFVTSYAQGADVGSSLLGRKRRGAPI
ncbi:hypothetical protein ACQ4PT_021644 [Festuca glaucescens]